MTAYICQPCKDQRHGDCDTHCNCQHKTRSDRG